MFITIFTDASFCPNTKATGWAVWIKYGANGTTVQHKGGYIAHNHEHALQGELFALKASIEMCKLLEEHNRMDLKNKIIVLQSDCKEALKRLDTTLLYDKGAHYVKKKWVKAHTGSDDKRSSVNNWCDKTAYAEMKKRRHWSKAKRKHHQNNGEKRTII